MSAIAPVVADSATTPNLPEFPESSTHQLPLQVGTVTVVELEALPDDSVLRGSGRYATIPSWGSAIRTRHQDTGSFRDCLLRPVPREWTNGQRVFEVLALGASRGGGFMVTIPALIESARVLS